MQKQLLWISLFLSIQIFSYNINHVKKITEKIKNKQLINASRCDFRGVGSQFKGFDFSGAQLSGALFNIVNDNPTVISGTILIVGQNSDLSGCNFSQAILISTGFQGANLMNTIFDEADIDFVDFTNANLKGAKLDKAKNIETANFCGATMPDGSKCTGASWKSVAGTEIYCHCSSS